MCCTAARQASLLNITTVKSRLEDNFTSCLGNVKAQITVNALASLSIAHGEISSLLQKSKVSVLLDHTLSKRMSGRSLENAGQSLLDDSPA